MFCCLFSWSTLLSLAGGQPRVGRQRMKQSTLSSWRNKMTRFLQGSVLGVAAAFRRLFFFFGMGLGLSSGGGDASAREAELGASIRSNTAMKKPPVSVVSGEARRQCSAPGKVLKPRWGQEGRAGTSLKVPGHCCKASRTTSSFSSWQREHVE